MRKVLLATTALVALNVSAASADVSISGSGTFEIIDSGATTYSTDGSIVIKGSSTTDSGLTISAVQDMKFEGDTTGNHAQDSYIDIAGDFGSIRMGNTDNALDRMDGALPENMDVETIGATDVTGDIGKVETGISFMSPSFNGITVYASTDANGSNTGVGANYKAGAVEVMVQSGSGTTDDTAVAAKFAAGPVTVQVGAVNKGSGASKKEYRQVGASYTMGDIKVVATNQKESTNKYTNIGAVYTVAPGLTIAAEQGSQSSESSTWIGVTVSF
jgi:hypothetical protein